MLLKSHRRLSSVWLGERKWETVVWERALGESEGRWEMHWAWGWKEGVPTPPALGWDAGWWKQALCHLRAGSSHGVDSTDTQEEMLVSLLPHSVPSSVPVGINFSGALTPFHILSILPQVELREPGSDCVFHRELSPGSAGQEGNSNRKRSTWP